MPPRIAHPAVLEKLQDLTRILQTTEGFHPLVAALKNGRAATVDGAWNSSASLTAAALGLHAPSTLLVVLAHPRDVDPWVEDIVSFAGKRPVVFPAWDASSSEERAIDEVTGQRLRLLRQLQVPSRRAMSSPPSRRSCSRCPGENSSVNDAAASRSAPASSWTKLRAGWSIMAFAGLRPSRCPANSAGAAASSTSSRPTPRRPIARVLRRRDRIDPPVLAGDAAQPRRPARPSSCSA